MWSEGSVKKELILLISVMILGFLTIGYISYNNMTKLQKNLDIIYFGSYEQVVKLKDIREYYGSDLMQTVVQTKTGMIEPQIAEERIQTIKSLIYEDWEHYKNSYKTDNELALVEGVDSEINATFPKLELLKEIVGSGDRDRIASISYDKLFYMTGRIAEALNRVINYESQHAYEMKEIMNEEYESAIYKMWLILGAIFVLSLAVSLLVSKNIHSSNNLLLQKGRELKLANKLLKDLSIKDTLTGIYNRRYFELLYEGELKKSRRDGKFFCFVMIDIDHFKQYNDTYGHGRGDDVLKDVAKRLESNLKRPSDYIFRLGGEEFGAMFSGLSKSQSIKFANQILKSIEALRIEHTGNSASMYVTLSMGLVIVSPSSSLEPYRIIEVADDALYKAKEGGRNRVVVAEL
ncbi:MAG: diguanylate cyclase [Campylobacterales bacterium]